MKDSWEFSKKILQGVSRTFALNINTLEGSTHRAVLTGYLLFRIADCIEDSVFQPAAEKAKNLREFASIFEDSKDLFQVLERYEIFKDIWAEDSPERELMLNGEKIFDVYFSLPGPYRRAVSARLAETSKGMAKFQYKKAARDDKTYQLKDRGELRLYCYYAAGVVGKMLTEIFILNDIVRPFEKELQKYDAGFGEGLQITNIAKDWKKDLKRGWMYAPKTVVDISDGLPEDDKKIVSSLCSLALGGLEDAVEYISILPLQEKKIRLFCIIPIVLACATLFSVSSGKGNKISRKEVETLLKESNKFADDNTMLRSRFYDFKRKIKKHLS